MMKYLVAILLCLVALSTVDATIPNIVPCPGPCNPCGKKAVVNFVFLIDTSSSMADNIRAVRDGLKAFAVQIAERDIDPWFLIVLYGHNPEIILDWTQNALLVSDVLSEVEASKGQRFGANLAGIPTSQHGLLGKGPTEPILVHDDHDCKCDMHIPFDPLNQFVASRLTDKNNCGPCGGPCTCAGASPSTCKCGTSESAFEALLMVLCEGPPAANPDGVLIDGKVTGAGCVFSRHPESLTATSNGKVVWNAGEVDNPSSRFLILLTDEDADCSFWHENRFAGQDQDCKEPPSKSSFPQPTDTTNPWVANIATTAAALLKYNASLNIFMEPTKGPASYQFGDPALQQQNQATLQNFDADATQQRYDTSGDARTRESLQGRLLRGRVNERQSYRVNLIDKVVPDNPQLVADFFLQVADLNNYECTARKRQPASCIVYRCDTTKGQCFEPQAQCGPECTENCLIGGICRAGYTQNPANQCQVCNPQTNRFDWTTLPACMPTVTPPPTPPTNPPTLPPDQTPAVTTPSPVTSQGNGNTPVPPPPASGRVPTCTDRMFNGEEEGVDCGPVCARGCPPGTGLPTGTCSDGVQNQGELDIDCSGPNCAPCDWAGKGLPAPNCFDKVWNQAEQGTDCGGPCAKVCPPNTGLPSGTCTDGIQNQGELQIDCFGPCAPCAPIPGNEPPIFDGSRHCFPEEFNYCSDICADHGLDKCTCANGEQPSLVCKPPSGFIDSAAAKVAVSALLVLVAALWW